MTQLNEDQLRSIAQLAEHLDSVGARGAARGVRQHLSILRSPRGNSSAADLIVWAAQLVADAARDRDAVTEKIATRFATAEDCHRAAEEGGHAVAELIDTVIVAVVMSLAPMTIVNRKYPVLGEHVVLLDDLPDPADWPVGPDLVGRVTELDVPGRRVRIGYDGDNRGEWFQLDDIASVRTFNVGE